MRAGRWLRLVSMLLALLGVPACGQMGPLSLPVQPEAVASAAPGAAETPVPQTAADADEDEDDDDER